ncbi:hypothetical protein H2200_004692 [Cladophialophora chaetospira]|uniref:Putative transcription factor kapC n=1 Tax=Cladophialophora chaetospira TaxID=386627 RepID=A0AA39CKE4_9EURO|nr:hypothetical protein H2200_004692 [Cladophialophora chaetospira]
MRTTGAVSWRHKADDHPTTPYGRRSLIYYHNTGTEFYQHNRNRTDNSVAADKSPLMDYFSAAHPAAYYSTPEGYLVPTSVGGILIQALQQNINDRLRFGSIDSGLFPPPDQSWDPVDPSALSGVTDFSDLSLRQLSVDSEQTIVPPSKARRRAQNRASQRAFRERKEKHVKGLETQLELLHEKHQDLLCSYNKQSDSMMKLNRKIAKLKSDLQALKACSAEEMTRRDSMPGERGKHDGVEGSSSHRGGVGHQDAMPDKFDAFPFSSFPSGVEPVLYDGYELGLDGTIVNTVDGASASLEMGGTSMRSRHLPDFEDLLHMS